MSDPNKDLYGEREILNNYIELKKNFTPGNVGMLLWQNEATLCDVLRSLLSVPRQITPAPYNGHIDLAIQTLYIS